MAALLAMACGGESTGPSGVARAALLALARLDTVPPQPAVFAVRNDRLSTQTVRFTDAERTLFLEFQFTPFSLASVDGRLVCDTCTVNVTVNPTDGVFGFTLGPPGLVFRTSSTPTVTVSYARYADFSVRDSSARYPDQAAFAQALDIWRERAPDRWVMARGSGPSGTDRLAAGVDEPGAYLVAAPK